MIVSLIRTSPTEERWGDAEHEFAYFLANKMASGPKGTMHDINACAQVVANELLNSKVTKNNFDDDQVYSKKQRLLNDDTLKESRIVDICNSDTLIIDIPVHCEQDLNNVVSWAKAVCHLNSVLTESHNCSCAILNDKKKAYVMVTIGVTDEPAERAKARKIVRQALSHIKITNPVIFFRCFEDEIADNVDGAIDSMSKIQSNNSTASQMKAAVFH